MLSDGSVDPYPVCTCDHPVLEFVAVVELAEGKWLCASCFGEADSPFSIEARSKP